MKSKIAIRLTLYFSVALVAFALIIVAIFIGAFSSYTARAHKLDMEKTAKNVASTMADFYRGESLVPQRGQGMHGQGGGYGAYLKYLNDISVSNIWIVDRKTRQITCNMDISYDNLPFEALAILEDCFNGHTVISENFSDILQDRTITAGTPIILNENEEIAGVVLLHSSVSGVSDSVHNAIFILSIIMPITLTVVILLAVSLSARFTKPLLRINTTARVLAEGNYTVKTGIADKDEIGHLAKTIDTLSERLHDASQQNEKLEQLRKDFVFSISHELRTPVTVIRGSLEAIKDGVINGIKKDEYISAAHSESIHLERLVNDLLELSRLQNKDFDIERIHLNICDIIADVERSMRQIAEKKNIILEVNSDVQNYPFIGDYGRLRQLLMIAVDNAIKFSSTGGTVSILFADGKLSVEDCGVGIASDQLMHIFDRFHKTLENNPEGTGLGLSIAKQIAIRHGIAIEVKSIPGVKTVFSFLF